MRPTPAPHTNGHARANGADRRADREAEYLHLGRQLKHRYRRSLSALSVSGIARALMNLADGGRIDIETLRAELDGRDQREITRLLCADDRLGQSLRGSG
jgi:hypothetical protein